MRINTRYINSTIGISSNIYMLITPVFRDIISLCPLDRRLFSWSPRVSAWSIPVFRDTVSFSPQDSGLLFLPFVQYLFLVSGLQPEVRKQQCNLSKTRCAASLLQAPGETGEHYSVHNTTLLPSVRTTALGMFCGAKDTHHTFTPIMKHH